MIETRVSTTAPGFGWGPRTHDEVARWRGRGPVFGRAGIVPVTITGPERYVEGARGPALLIERGSTNLVSNPRGGGGSGAPWIVDGDGTVEAILDETAPHGTALRLAGHTGTIARIYETIEDDAPSLEQGSLRRAIPRPRPQRSRRGHTPARAPLGDRRRVPLGDHRLHHQHVHPRLDPPRIRRDDPGQRTY